MWKLPNLCFMCWPLRHPILLSRLYKARETVVPNRSLNKWIIVHFKHKIYRVGFQVRFFLGKSNDPERFVALCCSRVDLCSPTPYMLTAIITAHNNYNTISSWNSRPCGEKKLIALIPCEYCIYEGDQNTCWIQDFHWIMLRFISSYILWTVMINWCAQSYSFHKYKLLLIHLSTSGVLNYILICMSNTKGIKGISTL